MGYISALFVRRLAEAAASATPAGYARRRALCHWVGVDPDEPREPERLIPDDVFFGLLERVAQEDNDGRSIAIRAGASMRCDDYGAFGLAFKSAIDLWGSFQRVERYGRVVTSVANYRVIPGDRSAFMALRRDSTKRLGQSMTNELAVAAATALCREVCRQDFSPSAVFFSHARPVDTTAWQNHFRCPVHFDADRDGLEIANDLLRAGNRLGDSRISQFFDKHLERELTAIVARNSLAQQVYEYIGRTLSEGAPTISRTAERLGLSSRTLQRRLADEGQVYQDLAEAARRDLAERLLKQTEFSLTEIAFLTGYAEQSTFTRAFKRWLGQTPASYRRALRTS